MADDEEVKEPPEEEGMSEEEATRRATAKKFFNTLMASTQTNLQRKLNILLYGRFGTGKTAALRHCRKPILVICCDPNGITTLRKQIKEDPYNYIAFRATENEPDPKKPVAYATVMSVLKLIEQNHLYDYIGTLAVDGVSMLSESIMYSVIAKDEKHKDVEHPMQHHYNPMMARMNAIIRRIANYPCDAVYTAHESLHVDEMRGVSEKAPLFTGKVSKEQLPAQFDEVYHFYKEDEYYMRVLGGNGVAARSRLQGVQPENKRVEITKPNIRKYVTQWGYPFQDRPNLLEQGLVDENHAALTE